MRLPSPSLLEFGASFKGIETAAQAVEHAAGPGEIAAKFFADSHPDPSLATVGSIPPSMDGKMLPPGTWDATFADVVQRFGTTDHRRLLLQGFVHGAQPLKEAEVPFVEFGGTLLRNETPRDIDVAWPSAGANTDLLQQREPLFLSGNWKEQKRKYGGEFRRDDFHWFRQTRDKAPVGVVRVPLSTVPRISETIGSTWFEDKFNTPVLDLHRRALDLARSDKPSDAVPIFSDWLKLSEQQLGVRSTSRTLEMHEIDDGSTLLSRYRQVRKFMLDIKEPPSEELDSRIDALENILRRESMRMRVSGGW